MERPVELGAPSDGGRRFDPATRRRTPAFVRPARGAAWSLVPIAAILAGAWAWRGRAPSSKESFPRHPSEFASPGVIDKRLEAVETRLKASSDDIQALIEGGILRFEKGADQYPDAINELHEARRLGASDSRIFYYLGVMYQEEGLYAKAAEEYQRFLRNRPADVETRMLLAKLQYQAGLYEDAAAQYRRLAEFRPKDALVSENLGLSLWKAGHRDDAAAILTKLSTEPGAARRRAMFHLGQIHFEAKDYKQALRDYAAVLPLDGSPELGLPMEDVRLAVAANFDKLKLYRQAKEHYEAALALNPQNSQTKSALKAAIASLEKADRAARIQREKAQRAERLAREKAERAARTEKAAKEKAERKERAAKRKSERADRPAPQQAVPAQPPAQAKPESGTPSSSVPDSSKSVEQKTDTPAAPESPKPVP